MERRKTLLNSRGEINHKKKIAALKSGSAGEGLLLASKQIYEETRSLLDDTYRDTYWENSGFKICRSDFGAAYGSQELLKAVHSLNAENLASIHDLRITSDEGTMSMKDGVWQEIMILDYREEKQVEVIPLCPPYIVLHDCGTGKQALRDELVDKGIRVFTPKRVLGHPWYPSHLPVPQVADVFGMASKAIEGLLKKIGRDHLTKAEILVFMACM